MDRIVINEDGKLDGEKIRGLIKIRIERKKRIKMRGKKEENKKNIRVELKRIRWEGDEKLGEEIKENGVNRNIDKYWLLMWDNVNERFFEEERF